MPILLSNGNTASRKEIYRQTVKKDAWNRHQKAAKFVRRYNTQLLKNKRKKSHLTPKEKPKTARFHKLSKAERKSWWKNLSDEQKLAYIEKKQAERGGIKKKRYKHIYIRCPICDSKEVHVLKWDDEYSCALCLNCHDAYYEQYFEPGIEGFKNFKENVEQDILDSFELNIH